MTEQQITNVTGTPGEVVLDEGVQAQYDAELAQLRADVDAATERAQAAETAAAEAEGKTPVFAVYDRTYERFVGNVHETKEKAVKAAKDAKVKSYRVDEVYR